MGTLFDDLNIRNNIDCAHEYVGAAYTLHVYDILKTAQPPDSDACDLFQEYDADLFGLGKYPIFDESKRKELNDVIIMHYLMFEIGYETEFLFRIAMESKMQSIMPKYNAMLSVIAEMEQKGDVTSTTTSKTTHNENRTTDTTSKNRFSDTPQQSLDNIALENGTEWVDKFLTTGAINSDKGKGTLNYGHAENRRNMSYGKLLEEIATDKFSVYEMICDELKDLFMGLFA